MKQLLTTFLALLLVLPWSVVTAGACPMGHAGSQMHSEPEQKAECCSHKHAGESQTRKDNRGHNKSAGCSGDCCPVCHLVQDTPQTNDDIQTLRIYNPHSAPHLNHVSVSFFSSSTLQSRFAFASHAPPLPIPLLVPLRI